MKYTVDPWIFEKNPETCFGIIVADGLKNSETTPEDALRLDKAQAKLQKRFSDKDIKEDDYISQYRFTLQNFGINPNKYTNSVEAMSQRIIKGKRLPNINALVDLCNAISIEEVVSLGGHDLADIRADLHVRKSVIGDKYLPFGATEFEKLEPGEIIFTSGNTVQTRQWLWRQSEIGKMTLNTNRVFFQLVGFKASHSDRLEKALSKLEEIVINRFDGMCRRYLVDNETMQIEF